MVMVRKQVYLSARADRELKREAKRRGISEAAIIRERLDHTCAATTVKTTRKDEAVRRRFIKVLEESARKASEYKGPDVNWKFNREDAYEERLERQMPR